MTGQEARLDKVLEGPRSATAATANGLMVAKPDSGWTLSRSLTFGSPVGEVYFLLCDHLGSAVVTTEVNGDMVLMVS